MSDTVEPVLVLPLNEAHLADSPPLLIDRRSRGSALKELSAGFVDFPDGGELGPWTLPYEEVFYVIAGKLSLHYDGKTVSGEPGSVITIERGATVTYEGTPGTRVFFSLVPANWMETQE